MEEIRGVTIVAEAAQGFEGDTAKALMLVRAAAAASAGMIKFQLVYADEISTSDYRYYTLFKKLEMPVRSWEEISEAARREGIEMAFDVYGIESLQTALRLKASAVKIHTTDFFNLALIQSAMDLAPQVFFSVGGISIDEIDVFLRGCSTEHKSKLTLLYGYQSEPTAAEDNHLNRLAAFRLRFPDLRLGFMDHADGDSDEAGWLGLLSLPYQVSVIEKHITIDRALKWEDYVSALNPAEFAQYVRRVRAAEKILGTADLKFTEAEKKYRRKVLKSVVAARPLSTGARVQPSDVALLRAPLDEDRQPMERIDDVVGRGLLRAVNGGEPLYRDDLAGEKSP